MKTKILVIEDNVITLDDIEYRLIEMGYEVETAVSSDEAIKKAESFSPDLILSDINLGDNIDGIETINLINQKQDIPIIYITAYDDKDTLERAHITEPYAYLIKPVQERELSIAIRIALYKDKMEKKCKNLSNLKNKFFSLIAHDLSSPFASITGLSDLLINNYEDYDRDKIKQYLKLLNKSSRQAYDLTCNLLQWSRSQFKGIVVSKQKTHLLSFVIKVLEQIIEGATKKKIDVKVEIDKAQYVSIDHNIIEVVLRNLISNAIKFTPEGGKITLNSEIEPESNKILLSVIDTGVGMSQEILNELFKIDKNVSTPGTNKEMGNGLGLILCKEFILKHGDKLTVRSELGKGSVFSITLPIVFK